MVVDFMKKSDMNYALSVFVPECGFGSNLYTKAELEEVLQIKSEKRVGIFSNNSIHHYCKILLKTLNQESALNLV